MVLYNTLIVDLMIIALTAEQAMAAGRALQENMDVKYLED
jgi:hypothetical protein